MVGRSDESSRNVRHTICGTMKTYTSDPEDHAPAGQLAKVA